ncbi:MAG: AAA family ATPase, partial [Euryarchaeota archaeon]
MTSDSEAGDRGHSAINPSIIELRKAINDLTKDSQDLLTEKLFLENEVHQLKKRVSRLDEEVSILKEPPFIVGFIQDITGNGAIVRSSNGTIFQVSVNPRIDSGQLKAGARVSLNQDTLAIIDVLNDGWDPLVSTSEIIEKPDVSFKDIGGMKEEILSIQQAIELPLNKPEAFDKMGLSPPKGVLLTGPPGTGKTMLAKAIANSTSATFLGLVGSELAQKYIGEGGRLVRELFDLAKEKAPSIIFIDEIDSIGSKRLDSSTSGDREVQRTLMQLLSEMDGFESNQNVKIIAATNRPELLDKALLRPG